MEGSHLAKVCEPGPSPLILRVFRPVGLFASCEAYKFVASIGLWKAHIWPKVREPGPSLLILLVFWQVGLFASSEAYKLVTSMGFVHIWCLGARKQPHRPKHLQNQ